MTGKMAEVVFTSLGEAGEGYKTQVREGLQENGYDPDGQAYEQMETYEQGRTGADKVTSSAISGIVVGGATTLTGVLGAGAYDSVTTSEYDEIKKEIKDMDEAEAELETSAEYVRDTYQSSEGKEELYTELQDSIAVVEQKQSALEDSLETADQFKGNADTFLGMAFGGLGLVTASTVAFVYAAKAKEDFTNDMKSSIDEFGIGHYRF